MLLAYLLVFLALEIYHSRVELPRPVHMLAQLQLRLSQLFLLGLHGLLLSFRHFLFFVVAF